MKARLQLLQKSNVTILVTAAVVLLQACAGPYPGGSTATRGGPPITAEWTKIVRGANSCPLTAQSVGDGNNPKVRPNEPLSDLSVNASDDKKVTYSTLAAGLPNPNYGFTTLGDLRKANKFVLIVRDPLPNNPYHCLLSVITPNEVVSKIHCK
jgi:hypothetical protein